MGRLESQIAGMRCEIERLTRERDDARGLADACCAQRDASDAKLLKVVRERDEARDNVLAEFEQARYLERRLEDAEQERDEARDLFRTIYGYFVNGPQGAVEVFLDDIDEGYPWLLADQAVSPCDG